MPTLLEKMKSKPDEFSWATIYKRRRALAKEVARELELSFGLTAGIKEPFNFNSLPSCREQFWADKPLWRIPFFVIGERMHELTDHYHVIDHAWWLIADDSSGEPWGFVTEPYMDVKEAQRMAAALNHEHNDSGITTKVWPKEKSPWYPGNTVPIVTTVASDNARRFLLFGLGALLEEFSETPEW